MVIVLVTALGAIAAALVYQAYGSYSDARRFPAPGRLVDVGGCRLHINEAGAGSPVVVLESRIAASSLSWALVQPKIAEFTRVCSYDRAGLSWSDPCTKPRSLVQLVSELESLFSKAALPGPYILVGHSFGALVLRVFAHRHPNQVAGLIFVDPVSIEYWANCGEPVKRHLAGAVKLSRRGALLARTGAVRAALAALASGGKRLPKWIAHVTAGRGRDVISRLVGEVQKLPPEMWPVVRAHWSRPKSFAAMAAYLELLPASACMALSMAIPEEIPFIVLSASNASAAEIEERDSWIRQSQCGRHMRLENTGHWLQLERPNAVIAAIRELVETHKKKSTGALRVSAGALPQRDDERR